MLARSQLLEQVGVHETERAQTRCLAAFRVDQRGRGAGRGLRRDLGHRLEQATFRCGAQLRDPVGGLVEHLGQLDRRR